MAIFIEVSNQNMLWNTMQKLDLFKQSFSNENDKMNWFKMAIANVYDRNKNLHLTKDDLSVLNRESIKYMIQILKSQNGSNFQAATKPKIHIMNNSDPYETLKHEYETMKNPKEPANRPDFSEPIEDAAIENIGELIEKQKNERARDLSVHQVETIELNDNDLNTPHNKDPKIEVGKKTVSWDDENQWNKILSRVDHIEKRMDEITELLKNNHFGSYNQFSF